MKIASWNVNSVNARLPNILEWLDRVQPDILFMQEIKCENEKFPTLELSATGYLPIVHGQKSYNGVAMLSKDRLDLVSTNLSGDENDEQARFIEVDYKGVRFINIYLPNGNGGDEKYAYKLGWMDRLYDHVETLLDDDIPFLIGGDFNVIPEDIDCYSPAAWEGDALFRPETHAKFQELINTGLTDSFRRFNQAPHEYTFWDYQAGRWQKDEGIRIDHFLTSPEITDIVTDCYIDKTPRGMARPSDHTPIILEIDL